MATLTYECVYSEQWSGTININYTTSYDRSTNKTTVTFSECSAVFGSRYDYKADSSTAITVAAGDNTNSSGTASFSTSGYGTGGTQTYTGTPSPISITVQHSSGAGAKTVTISGSSTITARLFSSSSSNSTVSGSGSTSVTSTTLYTFYLNISPGVTVDVRNVTNGNASLANKDLISAGDTLKLWRTVETGYTITASHFGGGGVLDTGASHTVTGNTTVTVTAEVNSYSLTLTSDANSSILVNRTSSPLKGASTGNLATGSTIYYNDVLLISFSANSGYEIAKSTVNDLDFVSGDSHTVNNNVIVVVISKSMGVVYIDNGTTIEKYLVYVDNGSSWDQYVPYVDDGSSWHICS